MEEWGASAKFVQGGYDSVATLDIVVVFDIANATCYHCLLYILTSFLLHRIARLSFDSIFIPLGCRSPVPSDAL